MLLIGSMSSAKKSDYELTCGLKVNSPLLSLALLSTKSLGTCELLVFVKSL